MNPLEHALQHAREADRALAEHRKRRVMLDNVIALADASVAACLAELGRENAARLRAQAERFARIERAYAASRARISPDGPWIAPQRVSPPTTRPTPHEPDPFVASIASRLLHP